MWLSKLMKRCSIYFIVWIIIPRERRFYYLSSVFSLISTLVKRNIFLKMILALKIFFGSDFLYMISPSKWPVSAWNKVCSVILRCIFIKCVNLNNSHNLEVNSYALFGGNSQDFEPGGQYVKQPWETAPRKWGRSQVILKLPQRRWVVWTSKIIVN